MSVLKKSFFLFFIICSFFLLPPQTLANTSFNLIPPSGSLSRNQSVQFIIEIDTQNQPVKSIQIGLTYQTQYLQYLSMTPGEAMTQVTVQDLGGGKLLFSGSNPSGFSGKGNFVYVNFKIIADAPGVSELCAFWTPSTTPTVTPTPQPGTPTATPIPVNNPTALPRSGNMTDAQNGGLFGISFLVFAGLLFIASRNTSFLKSKNKRHHKIKK